MNWFEHLFGILAMIACLGSLFGGWLVLALIEMAGKMSRLEEKERGAW